MEQVEFAKELKGKRIILRKHVATMEYAEEAFSVFKKNKSIVAQYLDWADRFNTAEEYLNNFIIKTKDEAEYALILDGKIIGQLGFWMDLRHDSGDLWYWLDKDNVGNGYMQEAIKVLEKHIFDLGFYLITVSYEDHNPKSKKTIEKCGYIFEGISRQKYVTQGKRHDTYNYSKLITDYKKV
jgi:RimJ/RimL family protein N-acetyltransferase